MRTEVLFEAVRTEAGNLALLLGGIEAAVYMPPSFWKKMAKRLNKQTREDDYLDEEELARKKKIAKIIREALQRYQN
ncbi:MAG: hypothetical protein ACE5HR_01895 [bacterium]